MEFKSQLALKKYFREIIDKIGVCDSVKTKYPEYYLDFCNIFKRHPGYPEKFIGLNDVVVKYNLHFKNQLEVHIKNKNSEMDVVSIMKECVTGKPKDNLNIAMRTSIQQQIYDFRNKQNKFVCELCETTENIEIDHHSEKMTFAKLCKNFMNQNALPTPIAFDEDTKSHMKCFRKEDEKFKNSWNKYHKEHAILRMLCKLCNVSQNSKKIKNKKIVRLPDKCKKTKNVRYPNKDCDACGGTGTAYLSDGIYGECFDC